MLVYPFRTADGKGERRSVSFNAVISIKKDARRGERAKAWGSSKAWGYKNK